jgi:hypothetical protein
MHDFFSVSSVSWFHTWCLSGEFNFGYFSNNTAILNYFLSKPIFYLHKHPLLYIDQYYEIVTQIFIKVVSSYQNWLYVSSIIIFCSVFYSFNNHSSCTKTFMYPLHSSPRLLLHRRPPSKTTHSSPFTFSRPLLGYKNYFRHLRHYLSLFLQTQSLLSSDIIMPIIKVICVISTNKHPNSQTPA